MYFGRGKNKIQNPYTFRDMYEAYIEEVGDNSLYFVEYDEFVKICGDYYKMVIDSVFDGEEYKIPWGLGRLKISKRKVNINRFISSNVDWEKTVDVGKPVFHLNDHSGGYKYFFHWVKSKNRIINKYVYRLVMTRANKRRLASVIKSGKADYYEV